MQESRCVDDNLRTVVVSENVNEGTKSKVIDMRKIRELGVENLKVLVGC